MMIPITWPVRAERVNVSQWNKVGRIVLELSLTNKSVIQTLMDEEARAEYDGLIGFSSKAVNPFMDQSQDKDQVQLCLPDIILMYALEQVLPLVHNSASGCRSDLYDMKQKSPGDICFEE